MGNRRVSSATSARTFASTATFPDSLLCAKPSRTSTTIRPTSANSLVPKPREVAAGDPRRMPEVTMGFCGANGMPFLFQGVFGRSTAAPGRLAGQALGRQIDQHQMVVGAPSHKLVASGKDRLGERFGVGDHGMRVSFKFGGQSLVERHRLGGDDMHERTALQARKDRGIDLLGEFAVI